MINPFSITLEEGDDGDGEEEDDGDGNGGEWARNKTRVIIYIMATDIKQQQQYKTVYFIFLLKIFSEDYQILY